VIGINFKYNIRLLYDIEFDDNVHMNLSEFGIVDGSRLTITNDYDYDETLNVCAVIFMVHK
jgi:Fe2+ transport system protein FeoA